jgi:hypothetical protein
LLGNDRFNFHPESCICPPSIQFHRKDVWEIIAFDENREVNVYQRFNSLIAKKSLEGEFRQFTSNEMLEELSEGSF